MFFYIKDKSEKVVNLSSVSNIVFIKNEHRVIFNMNYACSISSMGAKRSAELADYIYWDTYTDEDIVKLKNSQYIKDNFISFPGFNRLVNKNSIASVKFDYERKRIIINLNCSIRLKPDEHLSSDFIFVNAPTPELFEQYKNIVTSLI